ncbi:MAG: carboxypeptidase regulatory-like domain-containing protein, partial [Gemmatimonadota bacterium]
MSFLDKFWRLSAVALMAALPFVAACSDDDGAAPPTQDPPPVTGTISGSVTSSADGSAIVGALVGTSPATAPALTDAAGNFVIPNVPIPTNPTSYAVTASVSGFSSASVSVSLSNTAPAATANIALAPQVGPPDPTMGDLNVLVTNRTGEPQSGAQVDVAGTATAMATTDANGFAIFTDLAEGAYTVTATKTISGFDFRASGGTNIVGGETSFLQLTLARDFGQSVFPNIDGEAVTLTDDADIFFVPVPGNDSDPSVDCNIIRSQHMFIAEVEDGSGTPVSGVKVQWDLNISTVGQCNELFGQLRCEDFIPGNTGSVVDSDDPDLDPATARSGLNPAFNVDTRKAVTFTNDNDQTIAFNGQNVVVGTGQTWIIITSPVEGITDVIAATPDIPINDPECANNAGAPCDKEFAIKRWVNWDTRVAELTGWNNEGDPDDDVDSVFTDVADGATLTNILQRAEDFCGTAIPEATNLGLAQVAPCELQDNSILIYTEVTRLRDDSPFQFNHGAVKLAVTDDVPDVEIFDGFFNNVRGTGIQIDPFTPCDLQNDGLGGPGCDDEYDTFAGPLSNGLSGSDDLGLGEWSSLPLLGPTFEEGWVVFEVRLNPAIYFCDDVNLDTVCDPGNVGSPDTFSTAYQQLLDGNADNTNSFSVTFCDEFGEECDRVDFDKEWVASRVQIIKNIPGFTIETVDGKDVKHHTVQIGQSFSYTITVINDGEVQSPNVRITDTLPRFGVQFEMPDDGLGVRDGSQAFQYVTDRPTFDPVAVVYGIDEDDDEGGDTINECIRGDDGTTVGNAYVEPAPCSVAVITDAGTISSARTAAESASASGDQVVWIQWFDDEILGRQQPGGGIETEDTVEVTLTADESNINGGSGYGDEVPGVWCNIATATDGPDNLDGTATQSLAADTLCHEVVEALLDVRKTTQDAIISAGAQAAFDVEIENNGSATLANTVIVDTLDQSLFDATPGFNEDNIVLDDDYSDATVTVNGRIFTVDIGDLAPTSGFDLVYTVLVNTPGSTDGVFCNRVTASGTTPAGTLSAQDIACVTTTTTIELDVSNDDGELDAGGAFQSTKESFAV